MRRVSTVVAAFAAVTAIGITPPVAAGSVPVHSCHRFAAHKVAAATPPFIDAGTGYYFGFARIRSTISCTAARKLIVKQYSYYPTIPFRGAEWRFVGYSKSVWHKTVWRGSGANRYGSSYELSRGGVLTDGVDNVRTDVVQLRDCSVLTGVPRKECIPITFADYGRHL